MILVVGLGNPGKEYEKTRHNAGFLMLDYILGKIEWGKSSKANTFFYKNKIGKKEIEYLKPQTFMNNSGSTVVYAQTKHKVKPENIIVIYDDLDIPVGNLKISFNRSAGGHNGLASVIKKIKSEAFVRIRIGVSPHTPTGKIKKPKGEEAVLKFLLGAFKEDELKVLKKESKKVAEIIAMIASEGHQKAMSVYN
ncbi:MAG: aminoacyl-tRNA hydrolase [Candidatus Paceibacterota bacterium]